MTREEAIEWFKDSPFYHKDHTPFNMAISALEQEATLQDDGTLVVNTDDYKDVKRVLVEYGTDGTLYYADEPCEDAISISDNATNGDVIKAIFPNMGVDIAGGVVKANGYTQFDLSWWNAPYQKGGANEKQV